jgi:cyanophycin synthetase
MPITFGGTARHMIENALCAAAATLALELDREDIGQGLRTFGATGEDNPGRLHVYDLNGATVILDYAHNEVGLRHLLAMARGYRAGEGRLTAIIGTAGDRTDEALRELGRLAAEQTDRVIVKETQRYLRGRASVDEMTALYLEGVAAFSSVEPRASKVHTFSAQLVVKLATGGLFGGCVTVTCRS